MNPMLAWSDGREDFPHQNVEMFVIPVMNHVTQNVKVSWRENVFEKVTCAIRFIKRIMVK